MGEKKEGRDTKRDQLHTYTRSKDIERRKKRHGQREQHQGENYAV